MPGRSFWRARRSAISGDDGKTRGPREVRPRSRLRLDVFPQIMAPLIAAGTTDRQASAAVGALASLILGWVVYEQRPETREFVLAFHDPDEAFEYALDALVRGVEAKAAGANLACG